MNNQHRHDPGRQEDDLLPAPPRHRQVTSPLLPGMLGRPDDGPCVVHMSTRLDDGDFAEVGRWMAASPHSELRVRDSLDYSITDLDFLQWFPTLRHLTIEQVGHSLRSVDGLRHVAASLESLAVHGSMPTVELGPLGSLGALRTLSLSGRFKSTGSIAQLVGLEELVVDALSPFDLTCLDGMSRLRRLHLARVRSITDLAVVGTLTSLQHLSLWSLPGVRALPSLEALRELHTVQLGSLRGIDDLRPLASAPSLETLEISGCRQLQLEHFDVLSDHPTLRNQDERG